MIIQTLNLLDNKGLLQKAVEVLGTEILSQDWDDEIEIKKQRCCKNRINERKGILK